MHNAKHRAFVASFLKEQHRLFGFIVTLIPHRSDAEDVFQETSLRLWEMWGEFDQSREFLPWACGVAHNVLRNYLRKNKRISVGFSSEFLDQIAAAQLERTQEIGTRQVALEECLERLSSQQRQFVEQCYSTPRSMQELAETLGLTANALYLKLRRLREALLDCITRRTVSEART